MMTTDKTVGLYLHIPFCIKRCAYCDFYSQSDYSLEEKYVSAILKEAELLMPNYADRLVDTVYVGGGTPSSLSANSLKRLLWGMKRFFRIDPRAEITLEANPATLDREKLSLLSDAGVNRLSIGLQSVHDAELESLSRIHSYDEFLSSFEMAKEAIPNISLDLMYGLPGQTVDSFRESLEKVVFLDPNHVSFYALKIEEGTLFSKLQQEGKLSLPSDDAVADMYLFGCDYLTKHGFEQYEISNFAKQGCSSQHNIRYWHREEYLGLGPGAHSFADGRRYANTPDIHAYLNALENNSFPPLTEDYILTEKDAIEEELMLRLRLCEGISLSYLLEIIGHHNPKMMEYIKKFVSLGYMTSQNDRIAFTPRGFLVSNSILAELLPD